MLNIGHDYIECPICKKRLKSLNTTHLRKHGFESVREFKIAYDIPLSKGLVAPNTRKKMQKHGLKRRDWFKENVTIKGVEYIREGNNPVSQESRNHAGRLRRNQTWITSFVDSMKKQGWLDLHDVSEKLGIAYNYARKIATDKRLKTETFKGIRFSRPEWVEEARILLAENREEEMKRRKSGKFGRHI